MLYEVECEVVYMVVLQYCCTGRRTVMMYQYLVVPGMVCIMATSEVGTVTAAADYSIYAHTPLYDTRYNIYQICLNTVVHGDATRQYRVLGLYYILIMYYLYM